MNEKACRECNFISDGSSCPNCKSSNLSEDFGGLVIIINPEGSAIAQVMGVAKKGKYAIRVR